MELDDDIEAAGGQPVDNLLAAVVQRGVRRPRGRVDDGRVPACETETRHDHTDVQRAVHQPVHLRIAGEDRSSPAPPDEACVGVPVEPVLVGEEQPIVCRDDRREFNRGIEPVLACHTMEEMEPRGTAAKPGRVPEIRVDASVDLHPRGGLRRDHAITYAHACI